VFGLDLLAAAHAGDSAADSSGSGGGATSARGTDAGCVVWQFATETGQTFEVVPVWPDD
jgi:hypothetical protein